MPSGVRTGMGRGARTRVVGGVVAITALAIVAGFVLTRPGGLQPPPTGDGAAPVSVPAASRQPAQDVEIVMYQGEAAVGGTKVRLSQLWGKRRPVVLNFWAGLCPPCRAELPDFQALYDQQAQGGFFLIGVDVGPKVGDSGRDIQIQCERVVYELIGMPASEFPLFIGLGSREEGKALLRELNITFPVGTTFDARPVSAYQILPSG